MTTDDIISTFQLFEESKANATKHLSMHGTSTSKINLALKAKHVYEEEQSEEEEDDDEEDGDEIVGILGTGVPRLACMWPAAWLKGGPTRPIFINTGSRPSRGAKPRGADDRKLPQERPHQAGS